MLEIIKKLLFPLIGLSYFMYMEPSYLNLILFFGLIIFNPIPTKKKDDTIDPMVKGQFEELKTEIKNLKGYLKSRGLM